MNTPTVLDKQISDQVKNLGRIQKERVLEYIELLKLQQKQSPLATSEAYLDFDVERAKQLKKDSKPLEAGFLKGSFTMKDDFDEPLDDFQDYME